MEPACSDRGDSEVRIAVLASGRGSNFEALCRGDTGRGKVVLLITDRRDAPVLERAEAMGVEAVHIFPGGRRASFSKEGELQWTRFMIDRGIQLICLAGLMRIIRGPMLEEYDGRIMNIHPSILPSFPGLRAQEQALSYGVRVSGCTVHYVDAGVDTGPIIVQRTVDVLDGDTVETLSERILREEHRAYPLAVRMHCEGALGVFGRRVLHVGSAGGPVGREREDS